MPNIRSKTLPKQFLFARAGTEDAAGLEEFYSSFEIPGDIVLRFSRRPFFEGPEQLGSFTVLQAIEQSSGQIAGILSRSVRRCSWNGESAQIGFINHLRVRTQENSLRILGGLCQALRREEEEFPTALTLASISQGNESALGILLHTPLKNFPRLRHIDDFLTFSLPAKTRRSRSDGRVLTLESDAIGELLRGDCEKNFRPLIGPDEHRLLPAIHLHESDFLRSEDGSLEAALWDQSASKQAFVVSYGRKMRLLEPFLNLGLKLKGYESLPRVGAALRPHCLSFLRVKGNDPQHLRSALPGLLQEVQRRGGDQLIISLSANDPLLAAVAPYSWLSYRSSLFTVSFRERPGLPLDSGVLSHLEPGFL